MTTVAVLGLGRMGSAMAGAVARAGHQLILYNRSPERASALAGSLAATVADSPVAAAGSADVCISMVADEVAVRALFEGPDGLLAGARRGGVLIDSSTVPPEVIRSFEPAAHAAGAGLLDAPVSGSVALAEAGQLTLMVGGEAADVDRARPVLEAIGQKIFHLGPLGAGAAMKLAVNTVIFGLNGALSEGLVLAEAAGIDRALAYDVLTGSAAGAPFVGYKRAAFLDPDSTPTAFSLELAEKDLGLIADLAARLGIPLPQAMANLKIIRHSESGGNEARDFSFVAEHLRHTAASNTARSREAKGGGT